MDIKTTFIVYLILIRLSIIIAGIISIILGYRLFCIGVWPESGPNKSASFEAKSHGLHFTLKNAAPGIFFALFGVIIISIMITSNMPEFEMINHNNLNQTDKKIDVKNQDNQSLKMRSDSTIKLPIQK
jgi:hypothetical protein